MITKYSHTPVWVLDQDSAKKFYTEKLGFEVRTDMSMDGLRSSLGLRTNLTSSSSSPIPVLRWSTTRLPRRSAASSRAVPSEPE